MNQNKQIQIQELTKDQKSQHYYIEEDDVCYFFGEYTAQVGWAHSETNQLILNFKKKLDRVGKPDWIYKQKAINQVSMLINNALVPNPDVFFVPTPPSKNKSDPMYDDRLVQVLKQLSTGWMGSGYRELVYQNQSTDPAHSNSNRRDVNKLLENYSINNSLINPIPKGIIIFDDVLTSGCHYKAMQKTLRNLYPEAEIAGLFLARRRIDENPFAD